MYRRSFYTCRLCGKSEHEHRLVKYGVRHYAHHRCYIEHKDLRDLHNWQIGQFPWELLSEFNLMEMAEELIAQDLQPPPANGKPF